MQGRIQDFWKGGVQIMSTSKKGGGARRGSNFGPNGPPPPPLDPLLTMSCKACFSILVLSITFHLLYSLHWLTKLQLHYITVRAGLDVDILLTTTWAEGCVHGL